MASYGDRFRALRERAGLTQEQLVPRLKMARQGSISNIERSRGSFPSPKTIRRHAKALNCRPSELLAGVETEYDRIRRGDYDIDVPSADEAMSRISGTSEGRRRSGGTNRRR